MVEEEERVMLKIPPRVEDGTIFEIPLAGLGVHNFYLRVILRISEFA